MKKELTFKQKAFCHAYIRNRGNGVAAYMETYDSHSKTAARNAAYQLLHREDIKEYLAELQNPELEETKRERERIKDILWSIANDRSEKTENICRALDLLNKMEGNYGKSGEQAISEQPLEGISTEELRKMLHVVN